MQSCFWVRWNCNVQKIWLHGATLNKNKLLQQKKKSGSSNYIQYWVHTQSLGEISAKEKKPYKFWRKLILSHFYYYFCFWIICADISFIVLYIIKHLQQSSHSTTTFISNVDKLFYKSILISIDYDAMMLGYSVNWLYFSMYWEEIGIESRGTKLSGKKFC